MTKRVSSMCDMLMRHYRATFIAFWFVFIGIYLLLILWGAVRYEIFPSEGYMIIGGMWVLFVYLFYVGFFTAKASIAAAPDFNFNRDEYYLGILLFFLLFSCYNAILQTAAYLIFELRLVEVLSSGEIYFFSFYGMGEYTFVEAFLVHFAVALFIIAASHVLGILAYRWGKWFIYPLLAVLLFALTQIRPEWWSSTLMIEQNSSPVLLALGLFVAAAVASLIGWVSMLGSPEKKYN